MRLEPFVHEALLFPENPACAIPFGLQHPHQLPPPGEESIEFMRVGIADRPDGRPDDIGKPRERVRVDAVGFRELARDFR